MSDIPRAPTSGGAGEKAGHAFERRTFGPRTLGDTGRGPLYHASTGLSGQPEEQLLQPALRSAARAIV